MTIWTSSNKSKYLNEMIFSKLLSIYFFLFQNWDYTETHMCTHIYIPYSVQLLSHVQPLVTPWTAAHLASLSLTNCCSLPKPMSTELVMPSNHLILWLSPSPPALNLSQHQGLFKWVSSLHQVAKILEFQLQHQSFQWTHRIDLL